MEPVKEGLLVLALLERTENLMDSFGAPIRDLHEEFSGSFLWAQLSIHLIRGPKERISSDELFYDVLRVN